MSRQTCLWPARTKKKNLSRTLDRRPVPRFEASAAIAEGRPGTAARTRAQQAFPSLSADQTGV